MKKSSLLVVIVFLLSISYTQSQEVPQLQERYYYAFGEKIFLNEVKNKMIICFQRNYAADVKTLINSANIEWENDSICIFFVDFPQKETLRMDMLKIRGVKSVQTIYATIDGMEMGITDEVIMSFQKDVSQKQIDELHQKYSSKVKKTTDLYQLITLPNNVDILEIANAYQTSGLVKYSHPNFIATVEKHQIIPTDPYFVNQYYLQNVGQTVNGRSCTAGADIRATEAWKITEGSSNIVISVIDEGVSFNHFDLPNSSQIRLCGSNFTVMPPGDDPSPVGDNNHGNACAGVIAASHNNEGIAGIAPNCKIMPVRISYGYYPASFYADAITFAKINGADIISNSWGYRSNNPNLYPVIVNAIADAITNGRNGLGCVVAFSAGNTAHHVSNNPGYIQFPANVEVVGVLTVGASDRNDMQANYSPTSNLNSLYNQIIDIVAPSHKAYSCQISTETFDVWSIDIPNANGYNPVKRTDCGALPQIGSYLPNSGTNYTAYTGHFGGTSASCPQVVGVAALILSINPYLTQLKVASIIQSTARKAGNYDYQTVSGFNNGKYCTEMGYGVVDAHAAVLAARCYCGLPIVHGTITQNTTWNTDVHAIGTFTIPNNTTLTITSTVKFDKESSIIVEPGGKLIVNGGTLTNACPDQLWEGVFVGGNGTLPVDNTLTLL
jgi:subtilisin family serine protease